MRSNTVPRKFLLLAVAILEVAASIAVLYVFVIKTKTDPALSVTSPIAEDVPANSPTETPPETQKPSGTSLAQVTQEAIRNNSGTFGIVVKSLGNGQSYQANEHTVFDAGSLYKLWIMATAYQQIRSGTLQKTDTLTGDIAALNEKFQIATEAAELTEGTITLSVEKALNKMITVSDNYAALLLSEKVRLSSVVAFLSAHGLNESKVGVTGDAPAVTPADAALFFEKLYAGLLGNQQHTQEMLELLKAQRLNNKLPKYLPAGAIIAHKTGEIGTYSHDAGIVYTSSGNYVIAVLSQSDEPDGAEEVIANISKNVFDHVTGVLTR